MSTALALPTTGDPNAWTPQEAALVEAAGLVSGPAANRRLAPRPVVEAFLSHCQRTQLDPIARQIYCIERGGKWTTQISIDGARLVAERSREYRGQTPTQWTADGREWLDVWLDKEPPRAARVGIHREGFVEPLYAVATFDAYNAGSPIWKKMPALMLGKCAEMLALRKAFPQDLSGLYSAEEMDQADAPKQGAPQAPRPAPKSVQPAPVDEEPIEAEIVAEQSAYNAAEWAAKIQQCLDAESAEQGVDMLRTLHGEAKEQGLLGAPVAEGMNLDQVLRGAKAEILARGEA
ncbi:phage recombination protein Bet [Leucobacter muris]|uniref:Phage recombination protein Bet n=1 Tax=Leucobacter muris TaxID=1935379 RepID=A0ABX5QID1_9MICO|nr:phage recombination protein Bet [Leucobacter muris]QAB18706.1 phage recombination protein Bet [Leucobacter muris]